MTCPGCGFEQPRGTDCARCGIVYAKWIARRRRARESGAAVGGQPEPLEDRKEAAPSAPTPAAGRSLTGLLPPGRGAVRDACMGMARLLRAGVAMGEALRSLSGGSSGKLSAALGSMAEQVGSGAALAEAMEAQPALFRYDDVVVMRAAERIGHIPEAFEAIAEGLDTRIAFTRQIARGLAYPAFILLTSIFVIPFPKLFLGQQGVYWASVGANLGWIAGGGIVLLVLLPRLARRTPIGRHLRSLAWSLPWPGTLYVLHTRETFCRVLARGLAAGVPLFASLQAAGAVTRDPRVEEAVAAVRARVKAGEDLAGPIGQEGLIPKGDLMILISGERSGSLVESLDALAGGYRQKIESGLKLLLMVLNGLMTLAIFAYVAVQIMHGYRSVSQGADEMMNLIEKEMPYLPLH